MARTISPWGSRMDDNQSAPGQPENSVDTGGTPLPRPELTPAAKRALAEAEARRSRIDDRVASMPKELGGRGGLDPARYDDWEVKGIASDF